MKNLKEASRENLKKWENFTIKESLKVQDYIKWMFIYIGICMLLGYMFYNSVLVSIFFIPFIGLFFRRISRAKEEKRKKELEKQFLEMLHMLATNLRAGFSMENAFIQSRNNLLKIYDKEDLIIKLLDELLGKLSIKISIEKALKDLSKKCNSNDISNFIEVFSYSKKIGGNMINIINDTENILRKKHELENEIQSVMAGKEYEFKIMSLVPFGIIFYMKFSFPEFMNVLYGNVFGVGVMSIALVIIVCAYLIGRKIVSVEV